MPARWLAAAWLVLLAAPAFPAAPARLTLDDLFAQEGESDVAVSPSGRYIAVVVQQKDNDVLPYDQSRDMKKALDKSGRTTRLITLENEDHSDWSEENEQLVMKALGEFVESRIGPGFGLNLENHQ